MPAVLDEAAKLRVRHQPVGQLEGGGEDSVLLLVIDPQLCIRSSTLAL